MEKDLFEEDNTHEKADESAPEDVELFDGEVEGEEQVDETVNEPLNDEEGLLFEDEEGPTDEQIEPVPDEDESWIPLGSEDKGEPSAEGGAFEEEGIDIDEALKDKEEETIEIDETFEDIEREETGAEDVLDKEDKAVIEGLEETAASGGEEEKAPSDDEAWIPLGDEEIELSPEEEQTTGTVKEAEDEIKSVIQKDEKDEDEIPGDEHLKEFADLIGEGPEAPPWEEGVEIPAHGEGDAPKKKKSIVFFGLLVLVGLIAVFFVYLFLETGPMPVKMEKEAGDKEPSFVTRKMEEAPTKAAEKAPVEAPEIAAPPEQVIEKVNSAPIINGNPVTSIVEGTAFSFSPQASDPDAADKLTFFVTNQPAWMSFDMATGTLTGTPGHGDAGAYKNIVILVSDGTATASLPAFDLTVTGAKVEIPQTSKTDIQQAKTETEKTPVKEKGLKKAPMEKEVESKRSEGTKYLIPDLRDLIRKSEFQKAARAYHNEIKCYSNAYTLKLEVVCLDESVQLAFEKGNFDRRMFILPKQMKDRKCFAVFWGIYGTQKEALEATQSIPAFFGRQATKPQLVLIKQYL